MKDGRKGTLSRKRQAVRSYLEEFEKQGVRITVDNKEVIARRAAETITLNEHHNYMPDYLTDDTGRLVEIQYNKTRHY